MLIKTLNKIGLLLFCLFLVSCVTTQGIGMVLQGGADAILETDTKPNTLFEQKTIQSISVMGFDAKGVKTLRGKVIDYIDLGESFTDDLIRLFYESGKVKVTLGEYTEELRVRDTVERQIGDINVKRSEIVREVVYKATPFRKVDVMLSGRITRFDEQARLDNSYIEVYFKLTDTYDGTVYWISRIRGSYANVQQTLVKSISSGAYTPVKLADEDDKVELQ